MTRREWLWISAGALFFCPLQTLPQNTSRRNKNTSGPRASTEQDSGPLIIPFNPLPYDPDALEPFISREIMDLHYGRHHAGYHQALQEMVTRLNLNSRQNIQWILRNLDAFPEEARMVLRNQGGGHYNHELFWNCMKRNGGGRPIDELGNAISEAFGSYEDFQKLFIQHSMSVFGSGWCWLSLTPDLKLHIETTPNQDNPLMHGHTPIFGVDLWEHAYYLQYQNRRNDYLDAFFKIINWDFICERYRKLIAEISTSHPITQRPVSTR